MLYCFKLNAFTKIAFAIVTFLIGCQSSKDVTTSSKVVSNQFVVLDSTQAQKSVDQCSRYAPDIVRGWNPSNQQIEELEKNLTRIEKLTAKACCLMRGNLENVNKYIRQYVGVEVNGQQLIYINAFPVGEFEDWPADLVKVPNWKEQAYVVCDGGDYYWGAVYNPETNSFSDLAFNGVG